LQQSRSTCVTRSGILTGVGWKSAPVTKVIEL
jgi:hypothetical protein